MAEPDTPKIEFPCDYPIKVLGRRTESFEETVLEVFHRHAPGFDQQSVTLRDSRRGTFCAMTVTITATGPRQLRALHQDLMATGIVKMVL